MEEEMLSIVSNGGMKVTAEASDSNSGSYQFIESERLDHSSDISPEKIKGVVSLQNGNWGAQIYINHQRMWLGTFKSKREAAMAYDSAAIKLRNGDCHRNFPWTNITVQEPEFQSLHCAETILTMIKDGTYPSKFADYLQNCFSGKMDEGLSLVKLQDQQGGFLCRLLFEKQLTPSDVGKLNRLVIPKKYAIKYFPPASETAESNRDDNGIVDDLELTFYDRLMKAWKFRYCCWMSSQSFVFTRGWNRFVKEKGLKAKDHVAFYTCKCDQGGEMGAETLCMIDVRYDRCKSSGGSVGVNHCELWPNLGQNADCGEDEELQDEQLIEIETTKSKEKSGFRLFGVQIG